MLRLLLLLLNFNILNFVNENNYKIIIEEFEKEEIVQNIDEYSLLLKEKYYLDNGMKKVEIGEYEMAKMFLKNNSIIIIASTNGGLYKIEVDFDLNFINETTLLRE